MSVNLDGMFNVTHAFVDQLRARKGRVVNIGSIQSFVHMRTPNSLAYTTSKHGVLGFTRALAAELGKDGAENGGGCCDPEAGENGGEGGADLDEAQFLPAAAAIGAHDIEYAPVGL